MQRKGERTSPKWEERDLPRVWAWCMTIQAGQIEDREPRAKRQGRHVSPVSWHRALSQKMMNTHAGRGPVTRGGGWGGGGGQLQVIPRTELGPQPKDSWQAAHPLGPSPMLSPLALLHFTHIPVFAPPRLPDVHVSLGDTDRKQRWYSV